MVSVDIVAAVLGVIGPAELHQPLLGGREYEYTADVIRRGHLSAGYYVDRFEAMLCEATGAKYAVATCSGTCALHAALVGTGLTAGTVNIPALTFVATANAAVQAGMRPRFCEPEDAHIPVDILGRISPAKGAVRDSAQALGTEGITGTRIYSFNQNKIITTGGGGAVVTDDGALAEEIRHRITTARIPHPYRVEHDKVGFNYRMPDLNAAIGCAQLEQLPLILRAKRALYDRYCEALGNLVWKEPEGQATNCWLTALRIDDAESVLTSLHEAGIKARMLPTPLHKLKPYQNNPRYDVARTMELWRKTVCLPSSPALGMRYL